MCCLVYPQRSCVLFHSTGWLAHDDNRKESEEGQTKYVPPVTLQDFLDGCENEMAYGILFSYFMPALTRKSYWKALVLNAKTESDVATVSNEAFLLLVLDNNWERWVDKFNKIYCAASPVLQHEKYCAVTNVQPKYTRGCKAHRQDETTADETGKGWSKEGKQRFNELFEHVKENRKSQPQFFPNWLQMERERLGAKAAVVPQNEESPIRTKHELFSDSDSDDDNQHTPASNKRPRLGISQILERLDED